jgi:hypothetical protein
MIEIDEFKNLRKIQYEEEKTQAEKLKEQLDLFDASNLLRIVGTLILMAINLLYRDGFGFMVLTMGSILMAAISVLLLDRLPEKDFEWAHDPEVDGNYYYANITSMVTLLAIAGFEVWTTSRFVMTIIFFSAIVFALGYFYMVFHASNQLLRKWATAMRVLNFTFSVLIAALIPVCMTLLIFDNFS